MATKELKTRIALKYDSYAKWTDESVADKGANLKLLKGEIGICEIPSANAASNVAPTVLFKVGAYKKDADGNETTELYTFKELPWASAKAADVYGWAKAATVSANLDSKTIEFKSADGTLIQSVALNYVTSNEVQDLIAAVTDGLTTRVGNLETNKLDASVFTEWKNGFDTDKAEHDRDHAKKQTEITADIATAKGEAIAEAGSLDAALKTVIEGASTDASTDATIAGAKKYAEEKASTAETAAKTYAKDYADGLAGNYDAAGAAVGVKEEVIGATTDGANANTIYGAKAYADSLAGNYDAVGSAAAAQAAAEATAAGALSSAVSALNEKDTALVNEDIRLAGLIGDNATAIATEKADRETAITNVTTAYTSAIGTAKQEAIDAAASDAASKVAALKITVDANTKAITDNNSAVAAEISRVEGLINTEKGRAEGVESGLDTRLAAVEAFFTTKDAEGNDVELDTALDTLVEIQKYITEDGTAAGQMIERIGANEEAIGNLEDRMDTAEDDIDALEDRATAVEGRATTIEGKVEALEAKTAGFEGTISARVEEVSGRAELGIANAASAQAAAEGADGKAVDAQNRVGVLENTTVPGVKAIAEDAQSRVGAVEGRMTTAESDIAGLKTASATHAAKTYVDEELVKKVDNTTYTADKATFAVAETVNAALALKANTADVVANTTFETFKTTNSEAIAAARTGAVSDVEAKGYAVDAAVQATYATKTELGNVDKKFENYTTTAVQQGIDAEQDRRIKAIEDDYLVAADIADFETKTNVKKVADDLAGYVESNDVALAAEAKTRSDADIALGGRIDGVAADLAAHAKACGEADSALDKRIADLEANFGDGEGTVEAQIAAAVAAEAEIARAAEGANAAAIEALQTESAKHATKDELAGVDAKFADYTKTADLPTDLGDFTNNAGYAKTADLPVDLGDLTNDAGYAKTADINTELDKKADKSVVEAMYTNDQVDAAILKEENRAKGIESGLRTDVDAIKADYLKAADKSELQEQITANANAITTITNGVDPDKIDSLNDLINWADEHAPEVNSIKEDIEANAEAIAALETKKAIIDVAELPGADIDADATYRVLQGSFFTKNMERGDSYCYIVDEVPTTGESVLVPTDYGFGFTGYYNRTNATLYGYFNQDTIDDLKDYVNNSDLNQIVKMSLLAIINGLSTGWMTMEQIVNEVGTALSLEWGGIVTDVNDVTNANALYFLLSSELFSYQNDAWVGSNTHRVGRPGFGVGSEIFNDPSNVATGTAAHAEGQLTKATGNASHAEGYNTTASGTTSHVEGDGSVASGAVAHAEGYKTQATGTYSHAEGCESQATGIAAHASGAHTKATGDYSFAAGRETTAAGENSVAMGWASTANGKGTVVLGTGLNGSDGAVVVGNFNAPVADAAFVVGSGVAGSVSNALVVGRDGSVVTKKGPLVTKTEIMSLDAAVDTKLRNHRVTAGAKSDSTIGLAATAEGANTVASGIVAHAEGDGTQAIADYTHAEGYQTTANGVGAHAEGGTTTAEGVFSHTEGQNTVTTAEATWGHAEGVNTIVAGMAAHAEGNGTIAASYAQHVQGQFNIEDENTVYAHIVGNGTDDENRSNAHTVDWNGNGWFKGEVLVGGVDQYDEEAKTVVHTVNASETSGLKVTKEGGSVSIDIDTEIVWIFDCGTSQD